MKNKKEIAALVFCALLISFICGLPHIIGFFHLKNDYTLFALNSSTMNREEVYAFMPRVRQVLRGTVYPRDNQVYEHENTISPFINEAAPAYFMAIFSIVTFSIERAFILADFILPFVIFLLVYFFMKMIGTSRLMAVAASLCVVLARDFIMYLPYPKPMLNFLFGNEKYIDFLVITRNFHPEVSLIFLLIAVLLICKALSSSVSSNKYKLGAGIFLGLTFYTYIYHWTAIFLGLFLFMLTRLNDKKLRRTIIVVILTGLIVGLPAIINLAQFKFSPYSQDFFARASNLRADFPLSESRRFILLSLVFVFLLRKKSPSISFLNILIFSASILPDISFLVLKRDLQSLHWIWIVVLPFATILYFYIFDKFFLAKLNHRARKICFLLLTFSFIFYGIKIQIASINKFSRNQFLKKDEKSLIGELKKLPSKSVVMIYPEKNRELMNLNSFIPAITNNYIFVPNEIMTVSKTDEIIDRNIMALLLKIPVKNMTKNDYDNILINSYTSNNLKLIKENHSKLIRDVQDKINHSSRLCGKYVVNYAVLLRGEKMQNFCVRSKLAFSNKTYSLWKLF